MPLHPMNFGSRRFITSPLEAKFSCVSTSPSYHKYEHHYLTKLPCKSQVFSSFSAVITKQSTANRLRRPPNSFIMGELAVENMQIFSTALCNKNPLPAAPLRCPQSLGLLSEDACRWNRGAGLLRCTPDKIPRLLRSYWLIDAQLSPLVVMFPISSCVQIG